MYGMNASRDEQVGCNSEQTVAKPTAPLLNKAPFVKQIYRYESSQLGGKRAGGSNNELMN